MHIKLESRHCISLCLLLLYLLLGGVACTSNTSSKVKPKLTTFQWEALSEVTTAHLRGLFAVNDQIVWASGQKGTFLKTTDGGKTWISDTIPQATQLDFRDIHAFDAQTALVLSAGDDARIYKTKDGGKTWQLTYQNTQKGIFFDGFDFSTATTGMAYSDPIDGKLVLIQTKDGGDHWTAIDTALLPPTLAGEAGFAASGTGIVCQNNNIWIATGGGEKARVFRSTDVGKTWKVFDTPMMSAEGKGIFSMTFINEKQGVVVGGSYIDSTNTLNNCAVTEDGGKTWQTITQQQPNGYRSCVAQHPTQQLLITTGRTGSEYSVDHGKTWQTIGTEAYYSCALTEKTAWAVGKGGKMAKMEIGF